MTSSGLLSSSNIFPLNWSLMRTEDLSPWEETGEVEETDPKQRAVDSWRRFPIQREGRLIQFYSFQRSGKA